MSYMILRTKPETYGKEISFHFSMIQLTAVLKENFDEGISRLDMCFLYNIKIGVPQSKKRKDREPDYFLFCFQKIVYFKIFKSLNL